jgi:beta-glucosidase
MSDLSFPGGFIWGAATASYQIEGAVNEDGRKPSVWDTFCATPGKTENGESGAVACDHYHRYPDDVKMIADLGFHAYRFSLAWPRIIPDGRGAVNSKGIDFYNRLIDTLLQHGVKPAVTLFHWDYPQALEDLGGWSHPDSHKWFGDYTETCFKAFGDRVDFWITENEPWCHAFLGNGSGAHAPGNVDPVLPYKVAHGLLMGHGEAVARYRATGQKGKIGLTTNHRYDVPYSDDEKDILATEQSNAWNAGWFLDPIYKGDYSDYMKSRYAVPEFTAETSALVSQPTDFMGLNFYEGSAVRWCDGAQNDAIQVPLVHDGETQMGWFRVPQTLKTTLLRSQQDYDPQEIYITENGCAYDYPVVDGHVHDELRVQFLREYISAARESMDEGVKLKGYFVWSLMDNFEWAFGYRPRFGIVHVDYETQVRTPKDSALMMKEIAAANSLAPAMQLLKS